MTKKELTNEDLRRMQLLELDMIAEVDRVCNKHNINYVIYGGTLLGAIRHKGYIPWDDDADIAMLREDYNKFKKVSHEMNPDICWLQDHDTDPKYIWGYSKVRRTGTTLVRKGQEHLKYKTGVFIDIEIMDDVPKSLLGQILVDIDCYFLRKIQWSRVAVKQEKGIKLLWYKALNAIPIEYVFRRIEGYAKKSRNDNNNRIRILTLPSLGKVYVNTNPFREKFSWPKQWILERKKYQFENLTLWGPKDYDAFLRYEYNDYMKLPPEEKRRPDLQFSDYNF